MTPVVVIGAGPGGLTAANELVDRDVPVVVFEQDAWVGGIARTVEYNGFRFDIGGHRFFTKVQAVEDLWKRMLGPDFIRRPRLSRIYYGGRFFEYPLKPLNVLTNLGVRTSALVMLSYLWIRLFPIKHEASFADWVSNRFGRRLYEMFFKGYTEKVWGIPCTSIDAQWAAQRIKGLSLVSAVMNMLLPSRMTRRGKIKTLIDEFDYPRLGPGLMWEAFRKRVEHGTGRVELNARVVRLLHNGVRVSGVEVEHEGRRYIQDASSVISTMPMRHLLHALSPSAPEGALAAADRLHYRDFLIVALVINEPEVFRDNWIYIHEPTVKVGRIQNFKNWSPDMVPDPALTCLGMEYFCFEGDGLWSMADRDLVDLATRELIAIGLVTRETVIDGTVVRVPKAYPVYDEGYEEALEFLKSYLTQFSNLQLIGRNGMHKYNNQDHAMLTAILAVANLFGEQHDLWAVNADDEYHEEVTASDAQAADAYGARRGLSRQPLVPVSLNTVGATRSRSQRQAR